MPQQINKHSQSTKHPEASPSMPATFLLSVPNTQNLADLIPMVQRRLQEHGISSGNIAVFMNRKQIRGVVFTVPDDEVDSVQQRSASFTFSIEGSCLGRLREGESAFGADHLCSTTQPVRRDVLRTDGASSTRPSTSSGSRLFKHAVIAYTVRPLRHASTRLEAPRIGGCRHRAAASEVPGTTMTSGSAVNFICKMSVGRHLAYAF